MLRTLSILVIIASLGACTALRNDFETPDVTVIGFRPAQAQGGGLNFEIDLKVVNPNPDPLPLRGVAYTIWLEDKKLITGVGKDLPKIDGYGEGVITLTASAGVFEVMQLFGDFMGNPRDTLTYRLETKLDVGALYPAVRVKDEGTISLQPPRR